MIKHLFLSLLLCVLGFYVSAQRLPTRLPQINLKKLASISNNKARIIKYYKMMRRDSIRRERAQKRLFKNLVDSTVRANRRAILGFSDSLPEKDGPSFSLDSVMYKATPIQALPKSDSTTIEAFAKMNSVREILGEKTRLPDTALAQVGVNSDSLSQKVHSLIDDDLETRIPSIKTSQSSIAESISLPADTIPDLREKAVSSLADHAVNYLEKHQDKILFAQQRLAKLIRRYSEFRNSNNLDGAVKRSSLADKRFSERVVFNVLQTSQAYHHILWTSPLSPGIDLRDHYP